jgi:pimeloyl-ACP methyl ester carboxylesterase
MLGTAHTLVNIFFCDRKYLPEPLLTDVTEFLDRGPYRLAYRRLSGNTPGVMFCGGFMSDMTGSKATALAAHCATQGRAFLRFDYAGHGASGGRFEDGTISQWRDDALAALDGLTDGPQVVVGSSMGGWIALLLALARPRRVRGLVLLAPAPDFTQIIIDRELSPAERERLQRDGRIERPSEYSEQPYVITRRLIEDGHRHRLLDAPIALSCPVRIVHGMRDSDVAWQQSITLLERLQGEDSHLTLLKNGDHRLSGEADLARLTGLVEALCNA